MIKHSVGYRWSTAERITIWTKYHKENKSAKTIANEMNAREQQIQSQIFMLEKCYEVFKAGGYNE